MLFVPTLDGNACFGPVPKMSTGNDPRRVIINAYAAVDGEEAIDCGAGGRYTGAVGYLNADNVPDMEVLKGFIESFQDGNVHELFDTHGNTWAFVMLIEGVRWVGKRYSSSTGPWQAYEIMFKHLN